MQSRKFWATAQSKQARTKQKSSLASNRQHKTVCSPVQNPAKQKQKAKKFWNVKSKIAKQNYKNLKDFQNGKNYQKTLLKTFT